MLGMSMATGTGQLVAELVTGATPHIDPAPYSVRRF
jgi:D-amino-acid dehydrogenase